MPIEIGRPGDILYLCSGATNEWPQQMLNMSDVIYETPPSIRWIRDHVAWKENTQDEKGPMKLWHCP